MCEAVGAAPTKVMISNTCALRLPTAYGTIQLAVTLTRITIALAALTFSGSAWAEGAQVGNGFGLGAPNAELPAALALPTSESVTEAVAEAAERGPRKAAAPKRACSSASCNYRSILGKLVITRDLELPGTQSVAVRLFPTSSALAGSSRSTIVVRPRLEDSTYGFHLAARF